MRLLPFVFACGFASVASAGEPSFLNEVLPVLTKAGCNAGSCHGKGSGQNGFRLSLRGYDADSDYYWLVREFASRRVQSTEPESSLILLKATGQATHEGGRHFDAASPEYAILRKWIAAGCPGPNKNDAKILKLTVSPGRV